MSKKDIPERLDINAIFRSTGKASIRTGLILLIAIPAVAYGIGWVVSGQSGRFPTLIIIVMALSALFGFSFIYGEITDRLHPEKRAALRWSEIGTPDEVRLAIEDDWNNSPPSDKKRFGDYYITPSWIIHMDSTDFNSRPLRYAVWAYPQSKTSSINGITTSASDTVVVHYENCKPPIPYPVASADEAIEFLFALQKRAPWAFFGHREEYYHGWKNDREAFVAAARERYERAQTGQLVPESAAEFQPNFVND